MAASGREDPSGRAPHIGYALPGAQVAVDTDDSLLECWLDEFLQPGFDRVVPASDAPRVVVTSGTGAPALSSNAPEPLGPRPCFALDRGVVAQSACRYGSSVVITDEKYGARYRIEDDAVTVARDGHAPRSRAAVMRVVRELATARALADGSRLQLHAAALEHQGTTFVLAGSKEAGKTTLALRLASAGNLAIAANDRVLLGPSRHRSGGSDGWWVRPIPTVVSVRPGTQTQLGGMFDDIPAVPSPAHLTMHELDVFPEGHPRHDRGSRLKLSPPQFARGAGVDLFGEGRLGGVLLISVDPALDGFAIEPCTPTTARAGLHAVRYGSRPDGTPRTIFEDWLGVTRPSDADQALLDELAGSVPVCAVRVGPRVLYDDGLAAALLGSVLARA